MLRPPTTQKPRVLQHTSFHLSFWKQMRRQMVKDTKVLLGIVGVSIVVYNVSDGKALQFNPLIPCCSPTCCSDYIMRGEQRNRQYKEITLPSARIVCSVIQQGMQLSHTQHVRNSEQIRPQDALWFHLPEANVLLLSFPNSNSSSKEY